jgi:crotonobetainyl-CoA:carnitine CoA-transferase CaiB-like acyl-CoA transferase
MADILKGTRVLDFGRYLAGPYCAAMLADLGADVIRIDKIGGSEDRQYTPVTPDGTGVMFFQVNRNKRSITLDPTTPEGKEVVKRLVATADVVVANMPPQTLKSLGLDYETLCATKPDIILTSVSAFGSGGPYSERVGFDGIGQAVAGVIYGTGFPDSPVKPNVPFVDYGTAMACAFGTLAALLDKAKTGKGQQVEGALMSTAYTFLAGILMEEAVTGVDRKRTGSRNQYAGPSDVFATKDGWIITQVISNPLFKRWCKLVGKPELFDDPRFANDQLRGDNGEELSRHMSEWCAKHTTDEAIAALEAGKIPAGRVNSPREALQDPHARAIGIMREVSYPDFDKSIPVMDLPVRLSRQRADITRPPTTGEHTDEVLKEVGFSAGEIAALRQNKVI